MTTYKVLSAENGDTVHLVAATDTRDRGGRARTYDMHYVPRKRLTVEIEIELRKGVTKQNLLEGISNMPVLRKVRHQAQIVSEQLIDHRKD